MKGNCINGEFKLKNTKRNFYYGPSGSGKDTLGEHLKSKGYQNLYLTLLER